MLKVFRIDDGEYWWVAAESEYDACQYAISDFYLEEENIETITEVPSEYVLEVNVSDTVNVLGVPDDDSLPVAPIKDKDGRWICTATAAEWLKNKSAGDMICSSLW